MLPGGAFGPSDPSAALSALLALALLEHGLLATGSHMCAYIYICICLSIYLYVYTYVCIHSHIYTYTLCTCTYMAFLGLLFIAQTGWHCRLRLCPRSPCPEFENQLKTRKRVSSLRTKRPLNGSLWVIYHIGFVAGYGI